MVFRNCEALRIVPEFLVALFLTLLLFCRVFDFDFMIHGFIRLYVLDSGGSKGANRPLARQLSASQYSTLRVNEFHLPAPLPVCAIKFRQLALTIEFFPGF